MDTKDISNTLDTIIQQSHQVLTAIEEKRWDDFMDLENRRQTLFTNLQSSRLPNEAPVIKRIEEILSLNKTILSHSIGFQEELQNNLKNHRNQQVIKNAYKPLN